MKEKIKEICWFFTTFHDFQFTKYNNVLRVDIFIFGQIFTNFVFLPWKLKNPYYHILHPSLGKLTLGQHLFWSSVLTYFAVTRAKVPIEIHRYKQTRMLLWKSFTLLCQMAGRQIQVILFIWDRLRDSLHESTWIVLSVYKLNTSYGWHGKKFMTIS